MKVAEYAALRFICWFLCREHPKPHQKWFYGEAGNRTCDPWFTRHRFIPYTTEASRFEIRFRDMPFCFVLF